MAITFSLCQEFELNDQRYLIRKAEALDLPQATTVYNRAFEMWKEVGFVSKDKEEEEVKAFLLPDGYVIEDEQSKIVACACVRPVHPEINDETISITRATKTDFGKLVTPFELMIGDSIYFYGLAVNPGLAKNGMGAALFNIGLSRSRELGFSQALLETGLETWLVDWYQKIGFRMIAKNYLPNLNLNTVILHQPL